MTKKIIYIAAGALVVFGLLFLVWSFFFNKQAAAPQYGTFGAAGQSAGGSGGSGGGLSGNGQAPLGTNAQNGSLPLGSNAQSGAPSLGGASESGIYTGPGVTGGSGSGSAGSGSGSAGSGSVGSGSAGSGSGSGGATVSTAGTGGSVGIGSANTGGSGSTAYATASNVDWLSGGTVNTSQGGGGGSGVTPVNNGFTPVNINGINGASIGGTAPNIGGSVSNNGGGGSNNSGLSFAAAGIAGAVSCGIRAAALSGALSAGSAAGSAVAAAGVTHVPVSNTALDTILATNQVGQTSLQTGDQTSAFMGCILNTVAKSVLQQITASVVNWINSGFNGQPSFITNYQNFFSNVADLAAGQFIQGSGLSFLCSAFQPQIKIAIAHSYASRSASPPSCSLSKVVGNVNKFMNGDFSQGGWGGLLSFTTVPTNNPYGAYAYAQIGLANAQNQALQNAASSISPSGFLALQKVTCPGGAKPTYEVTGNVFGQSVNPQAAAAGGAATLGNGCKASITTPGQIISDSLQTQLNIPTQQLGLANDLDQILNALMNQLMVKTLYNGLSSLSGSTGLQNSYQTPEQQQAQQDAQDILNEMQAQYTLAQQYGSILQGSIQDIETQQQQINNDLNCWLTASSSSSLTSAQRSQVETAAANASSTLATLNGQITTYNNGIAAVNAEIAQLQSLETEALSVASATDVSQLKTDYQNAQAAQHFVTQTDVTTAQQNRTTLQAQMATLAQSTQSDYAQCQTLISSLGS